MKRFLSLILAVAMMLSVMVAPVAFAAETAPAADIIIEVGSEYVKEEGQWDKGSSLVGPSGAPSWYSRRTTDGTITFSTEHIAPGEYELSFYKIVHTDGRNDKAVPLTITHAGGVTETTVNCDEGSTGWVSIGKYTFNETENAGVVLARTGKTDAICTRVAGIKLTPIKIFTEAEATSAVGGLSAEDEYINQLFTYIGVSPVIDLAQPEAQVTRAQFLAAIMKALKSPVVAEGEDFLDVPATHAFYNEVKAARAAGIVAGDGTGYFNPDDAIAFEEAAKIAVHAMELLSVSQNISVERANDQGGFKAGYILEFNRQGLAKGLAANVSSTPLTVESVKTIIMNILKTNVREMITEDKVSILERVHGIYEESGRLNTVLGATVKVGQVADAGYVYINEEEGKADKRYLVADIDAAKFLGQDVDYYYVDDGNFDTVIAITGQSTVEVIEIDAMDILSADYSTGTSTKNIIIEYYDENSKVETVAVNPETKVYFNNVALKAGDAVPADFKGFDGTLKLVGNNGKAKFDYAFITSYENFILKSVNTLDEKIYDINNKVIDLKNTFTDGYTFVRNGKAVKLEKLAQWDVLSVPAKRAGTAVSTIVTIEFARKRVEGILESKNKKEFFLDGKAYELTSDYKAVLGTDEKEAAKFTLGKAIALLLDVNGYVAYADDATKIASTSNYAYLNKLAEDSNGFNGGVKIEAFLANGKWEELTLADEISYAEGDGVAEKITAEAFLEMAYSQEDITAQVNERYQTEVDALGLVNKIYRPNTGDPESAKYVMKTGFGSKSTAMPGNDVDTENYTIYTSKTSDSVTFYGLEQDITKPEDDKKRYALSIWNTVYEVQPQSDDQDIKVTLTSDLLNEEFYPRHTADGSVIKKGAWYELGVYSAEELKNVQVKFTPGSTAGQKDPASGRTICTRVGSIKLEEVYDYDQLKEDIEKEIRDEIKAAGPSSLRKVVEYALNSKGEVKEIRVLKQGTKMDNKPFFKGVSAFVSGSYVVSAMDANTVIFSLPEDLKEKEEYSVLKATEIKDRTRFNFTAYDQNEELYAPVVVTVPMKSSRDADDPIDFLVVKGISESYDPVEETVVSSIRVFSGTTELVYQEAEKGILLNTDGSPKYKFGDIIAIDGFDSKGRITDGSITAYPNGNASGSTQKGQHLLIGTVTDNTGSNLFIANGGNMSDIKMCSSKGGAVLVCDLDEETITEASLGTISIGDTVAYTSSMYNAKNIIIFKSNK